MTKSPEDKIRNWGIIGIFSVTSATIGLLGLLLSRERVSDEPEGYAFAVFFLIVGVLFIIFRERLAHWESAVSPEEKGTGALQETAPRNDQLPTKETGFLQETSPTNDLLPTKGIDALQRAAWINMGWAIFCFAAALGGLGILIFMWEDLGNYVFTIAITDMPICGARLGFSILTAYAAWRGYEFYAQYRESKRQIDLKKAEKEDGNEIP